MTHRTSAGVPTKYDRRDIRHASLRDSRGFFNEMSAKRQKPPITVCVTDGRETRQLSVDLQRFSEIAFNADSEKYRMQGSIPF
ncbi:hypothetical protein [Planotetraspora phitsanulokensis]|uniref:hypothetical protein n=1 Tax=Planotetraspora phitsanulokensis TaxID=575192 RepID=UPI0019521012|nr:hypothetical protein [Planotetraspora phitsanulokensis]